LGIVLFHDSFAAVVVLKRRIANVTAVMNNNFVAYCLVCSQNLR